jgi:hypothetical protein
MPCLEGEMQWKKYFNAVALGSELQHEVYFDQHELPFKQSFKCDPDKLAMTKCLH